MSLKNKKSPYPPVKKKFSKDARGLIAETRDFRGGHLTGEYLDVRLALELQRLLDEQDGRRSTDNT